MAARLLPRERVRPGWRSAALAAAAVVAGVALGLVAQLGHVARCPAGQAGCPLGRASGPDAASTTGIVLAGVAALAAIAALALWRARGPERPALAVGGVARLRGARVALWLALAL